MAFLTPIPAILRSPEDDNFKHSYENHALYPKNLIYQTSHPAAIDSCIRRLDDSAHKLFRKAGFKVPFRDYIGYGPNGGFDKLNVSSEEELKLRLGDLTSATPAGGLVTKADPICRFIFFSAEDSREPLRLNKAMLLRILTYHQVMSDFLDFFSVFGVKNPRTEVRDLRYSGFTEQLTVKSNSRKCVIPNLGRSGRQYQMCYNLKSVVQKTVTNATRSKEEWSIRQGAFHHQFDIEKGTVLWIVVHGREDIKTRVQELTGDKGRPEDRDFSTPARCFKSSLAVHLLLCHWSTEGWRWYIQWLEEVIEEKTDHAIHERRGMGHGDYEYKPHDIQSVQYYEDRTNEAIMVLEANTEIVISIRKFYQRLLYSKDFPLKVASEEDIETFAAQLDTMIYDSTMQIARAKVLVQITSDRKTLILQHLQSQATERQSEATEKMELLTLSMHKMGTMAQKESIAMRIITVVTLIYLPATFVSTFFSTDIIKYQNQQNGDNGNNVANNSGPFMESFSQVALIRWLQVSLPLTALTLAVGYLMSKYAGNKAESELVKLGLLPIYEDEKKSLRSSKSGRLWWMKNCCFP